MSVRLALAVVTTLAEEAIITFIFLVLLPELGYEAPFWLLAIIMLTWLLLSIFTYRMGTRALEKKKYAGLDSMIGETGTVEKGLAPEGFVKIWGELWRARSEGGDIGSGGEVVVVSQKKTKLIVRKVT